MGLGTWYMVDEFIKWMTWGHAQCDTESENTLKLFRAVYKLVSWCSCLPGSNPVSFGSGDHSRLVATFLLGFIKSYTLY